jgi:hypothetical protein
MHNAETAPNLQSEEALAKAPYVAPEVVDYGDAADVTRSGANVTGTIDATTGNYNS